MPNLIPRDFIDRLVSDSDIVSVLGAYLDLNKKGNNYVCKCPWHDEKTGSFTVSPQKSIYHCFGCGKGGNVLTFVQEMEGLSFVEAVEKLAEINGVTVPRESRSNIEDYSNIYQLNQVLAEYYLSALKDKKNKQVVDYLKDRGVTGETAKKFLIGYADFNQTEIKEKLIEQFGVETLLKSKNFLKNEKGIYPFFRNRLIFPIKNSPGKIIGFGGRSIDDSMPKYVNSSDSKFFNKQRELYGFNNAKQDHKKDYFIVTEGYMDVVMLSQHGIENSVASLGTAFSLNHLQKLFKLKKKVVFCFDSDEAGLKAAWKSLQLSLGQVFDDKTVRFLFLPEGEDPDSYVKENGQEAFIKKIERSMVLETFVYQFIKRGRNLDSPEDIRLIIHDFKQIIKLAKSETLKEMLLQKFEKELNIKKDLLLKQDGPKKKITKPSPKKDKFVTEFNNQYCLIIYLYENYYETIKESAETFENFLLKPIEEKDRLVFLPIDLELDKLAETIRALREGQKRKSKDYEILDTAIYAKAMMIDINLTNEEALNEFNRATDSIRLEFDKSFLEYLKELAEKRELSVERKENLQKLLNLSDNISVQEEELIKFLNTMVDF